MTATFLNFNKTKKCVCFYSDGDMKLRNQDVNNGLIQVRIFYCNYIILSFLLLCRLENFQNTQLRGNNDYVAIWKNIYKTTSNKWQKKVFKQDIKKG